MCIQTDAYNDTRCYNVKWNGAAKSWSVIFGQHMKMHMGSRFIPNGSFGKVGLRSCKQVVFPTSTEPVSRSRTIVTLRPNSFMGDLRRFIWCMRVNFTFHMTRPFISICFSLFSFVSCDLKLDTTRFISVLWVNLFLIKFI